MSQLYSTDTGRVVPTLCEELTTFRRARKIITLPLTGKTARLYLLARAYQGSGHSLHIAVNGRELPPMTGVEPAYYRWYSVALSPEWLLEGANQFDFWTDATAMSAWSLALENGHASPQSLLSHDGGQTWQVEGIGYLGVCRGEYVVRVRLAEGHDEAPPDFVWEATAQPQLRSLARLLPASARDGDTIDRIRALTAWTSTSWEYRHSGPASQYAPWDPETILAWGKNKQGHDGRLPIVMCVHYGVTMLMVSQAIGLSARLAIFTDDIDGFAGHLVTEVWVPELNKWVLVDPNLDTVFSNGSTLLSVNELRQALPNLGALVVWGPGSGYQCQSPAIVEWIRDVYLRGQWLNHRGIWPRGDLMSRPDLSPPGHGALAYSETQWVWETKDLLEGFGMFRYFGSQAYFDAPPQR